jgi:precorrin-2 dehydrogenase / sirohydrochlorin ferrochelatase
MSRDAVARPYAAMLAVAGRLAVVVGTGPGALRAAGSLVAHGADVVIIGTDVPDDLLAMEADGQLSLEVRKYAAGDLDGAFIAIAASGSAEVDAAVAEEARERGVLVNVAGDAGASDFIVPSVVRRGDLQIAITTAGGAPSVAREVRRGIAAEYGPEWEAYTRLVGELRILAVERTGLTDSKLAPLFAAVADSDLRTRLAAGEKVTAAALWDLHAPTVVAATDEGAAD